MRDILIGKLEVSTRIEVSFYEDQLISLKDFLKNDEKEVINHNDFSFFLFD